MFSSFNSRGEISIVKNSQGQTEVKGCQFEYLNDPDAPVDDETVFICQKAKSGITIIGYSNGEIEVIDAWKVPKFLIKCGLKRDRLALYQKIYLTIVSCSFALLIFVSVKMIKNKKQLIKQSGK